MKKKIIFVVTLLLIAGLTCFLIFKLRSDDNSKIQNDEFYAVVRESYAGYALVKPLDEDINYDVLSISVKDLKVGDIIRLKVKDIKEIINNSEENDIIKFKVLRNEKELEIENKVVLEDNRKVVGVVIVTDYEYDLDPKIDIKFKNSESGSSGGLMLTLTIYNAVSSEDLIKGRNIAGTGTINTDGTVGEIDGIKYKIMGAAKNNMDIVFVPSSNYEDAINTKNKYNYDLEIIKVDTFNEVLEYLRNN